MQYPRFVRLRQQFPRPRVDNIPEAVRTTLDSLQLKQTIKPGQTVALTAGSRGIANIPVILKSVVQHLKDLGAKPFLVPAMGSHGGGTAEGQRKVVESYGITESSVGAPIRASMEVVSLGRTVSGIDVVLDKTASEADHIGVVCRVKPHTSYAGPIESGLMKMMMIGLGKHQGALNAHRVLLEQPFDRVVREVGDVIRAKAPISFGVASVENAFDETALIQAIRPPDFEKSEESLLVKAKEWLARLPFAKADLLIIDEIGKEISGSGMDTNIVGRKKAFIGQPQSGQPEMRFIFVRGLSPHTHGNATGIGSADFTTTRLVQGMDYNATRINALTAGYPCNAVIPVYFPTDREVMDAALKILGTREAQNARVMHIRNTMQLEEVIVSEACLKELNPATTFSRIGEVRDLEFDAAGNLVPV